MDLTKTESEEAPARALDDPWGVFWDRLAELFEGWSPSPQRPE